MMVSASDTSDRCDLAREIERRSLARWGTRRRTEIVGRHRTLEAALQKAAKFAGAECPVVISGETGTGKELIARSVYLSSPRIDRPYLPVNCAQYCNSQLLTSSLFGHRKGSFTGADSNHSGVFEEGNGGVVFLDEVSELSMAAQGVLLRVLSEGEIIPVGGSRPKCVDVRVIAATNRDLRKEVSAKRFREDLYFRLRGLAIQVPSLRERGSDWELIARHYLAKLNRRHGDEKKLSGDATKSLQNHSWPGNVREVKSAVETGYLLSESDEILFADMATAIEQNTRKSELAKMLGETASDYCERMVQGEADFWTLIHRPYLERDLNRRTVREVVRFALSNLSHGSYKRMLRMFGVSEDEYLKAMDFLRHHDLKANSEPPPVAP